MSHSPHGFQGEHATIPQFVCQHLFYGEEFYGDISSLRKLAAVSSFYDEATNWLSLQRKCCGRSAKSNTNELISMVAIVQGEPDLSETSWEVSRAHLNRFIASEKRKGSLDQIHAIQVFGTHFSVAPYYSDPESQPILTAIPQVPLRHDMRRDTHPLQEMLRHIKRDVTRQTLALSAHSEAQVLSLWAEILEQHFNTRPDPAHTDCSSICCAYRQWNMRAHIEQVKESEVTLLTLHDILQPTHPAVVAVGCKRSDETSDAFWTQSLDDLTCYCQSIAPEGGMGDYLYIAQAHGRLVRWYTYQWHTAMQPLDGSLQIGGDLLTLDAVKDVVVVDSIVSGIMTNALCMFKDQ